MLPLHLQHVELACQTMIECKDAAVSGWVDQECAKGRAIPCGWQVKGRSRRVAEAVKGEREEMGEEYGIGEGCDDDSETKGGEHCRKGVSKGGQKGDQAGEELETHKADT